MSVKLQGLVTVYGPFGVGKSTLGWLASNNPKKIVYIDGGTSKEKSVANSLELNVVTEPVKQVKAGSYVDLALMTYGLDDFDSFTIQKDVIEGLPEGLDAVILDDVYFTGAHPYVRKHPKEFREGGIHGSDIEMKTAMEWGVVRKSLLPSLYTTLQRKAKLVLFLNRERPARDENGNPLPGATEPDADKSLRAASQLALRLIHNTREVSNIPAALVIKNARTVDPVKQEVVQIFPKRIPECTWDKIGYYLTNPIGNRPESGDEVPDEGELNTIWGVLSPQQQEQYRLSLQLAISGVREEMERAVKEFAESLGDLPLLAKRKRTFNEMGKRFNLLTEDDVEAWVA